MTVAPAALVTDMFPVACVLPNGIVSVELTVPNVGCEENKLIVTSDCGSFAGLP